MKPPRSTDGDVDERGTEAAVEVERVLDALYGDSEETDAPERAQPTRKPESYAGSGR
jgi:hypothetical protein